MADHVADQLAKWSETFAARPDFLGSEPSEPGRAALTRFEAAGVVEVLELGPGQGRDTLLFLAAGLHVIALDYAPSGLAGIRAKADTAGVAARLETRIADVRQPLSLPDASCHAAYAHMLLCMDLSTEQITRVVAEVRRVLRPGGLFVYTARTIADAHFGAGVAHGDDRWETGGFVVHFFDHELIERLADGLEMLELAHYEEGRLPRRIVSVTLRRT
jgi:SAM-dependent methyltransferase